MPANSTFFAKFPNRVLLETGTFTGIGVHHALEAGFERVISIELSPELHKQVLEQYRDDPRVRLILGDSSMVLAPLLAELDEPITFWLDGHFSGEGTAHGGVPCPLLQELGQIATHPIKSHTILIDDVRLIGTAEFGFDLGGVVRRLWEINPAYNLSLQTGQEDFPHDVLVARL